jgi:hypothetical protein
MIVGGFAQALHFFIVPETRSTVILENAAKKLRKEGREKEADAIVVEKPVLSLQHALTIWSRPVRISRLVSFGVSLNASPSPSLRCSFESPLSFF